MPSALLTATSTVKTTLVQLTSLESLFGLVIGRFRHTLCQHMSTILEPSPSDPLWLRCVEKLCWRLRPKGLGWALLPLLHLFFKEYLVLWAGLRWLLRDRRLGLQLEEVCSLRRWPLEGSLPEEEVAIHFPLPAFCLRLALRCRRRLFLRPCPLGLAWQAWRMGWALSQELWLPPLPPWQPRRLPTSAHYLCCTMLRASGTVTTEMLSFSSLRMSFRTILSKVHGVSGGDCASCWSTATLRLGGTRNGKRR